MMTPSQYPDAMRIVGHYYQSGVRGRLTDFAPYVHDRFAVTAPDYLPWGGLHEGGAFFRDEVLPNLPATLDFSRFRYDRFFSMGSDVVALIDIGVAGTEHSVKISEHWTVKDGMAMSIWVAYFEPQVLLDRLGIVHGLGHGG
ncbi:hypothetical protein KPL74_09185 [Bacillus sp. NP157]|nr:hypothetical protein KPL74_09185 [Bacillus sp. NP157]